MIRGVEVGRLRSDRMGLVFLDEEYKAMEDVFVRSDAELAEVKNSHTRVTFTGDTILEIAGRHALEIQKGLRMEVKGRMVWELTGKEIEVNMPSDECRLFATLRVLAPRPSSESITIEGLHTELVWD